MNEFLADLYGTRDSIGASNSSDVEKLAEAQVLDQVFKSEGLDVDKLPDETIVKVAYELFGAESAIVKAAEDHEEGETAAEEKKEEEAKEAEGEGGEEEKEEEKKDEEKTAADLQKADFLGRVMAHSFTQERALIEKDAAKMPAGLLSRLGGHAAKAGEKASELAGKAGKFVKKHPKSVAGAAAGAGAVTGFAAGRASKSKTGSAIDILAEKQAAEILAANGVKDEPTEEEKLAEAVNKRTLEILAEKGYTIE